MNVGLDNAFDRCVALYEFTECGVTICGAHDVVPQYPDGQIYIGFSQPRTTGIRFKQDF